MVSTFCCAARTQRCLKTAWRALSVRKRLAFRTACWAAARFLDCESELELCELDWSDEADDPTELEATLSESAERKDSKKASITS